MQILVINADCIFVNSSANLCHLAYLKGLVDAGHHVELLCADSQNRKIDPNMVLPDGIALFTFPAMSLYEWASKKAGHSPANHIASASNSQETPPPSRKNSLFSKAKHFVLSLYGIHGIYSTFIRKAMAFRSCKKYDYVISLSTPTASHLLAYKLMQKQHISAKHWIQIWEDPWASDAYRSGIDPKVFQEEKRLLSFAEKVCYVSPLTLENQKNLFPESAHKMFWQPLPFYYKSEKVVKRAYDCNRYGYFGAYYPAARDLQPFYDAAREAGVEVNICGDPAGLFTPTENIHIYPRLLLKELKPIEDSTNVLIFLCNRKGGQIPGKIYQYSATDKTILFVMDGTPEEQKVLREFFGKFNRYVFCQNTKEDIARAIRDIESGNLGDIRNMPLQDFDPVITIQNILKTGS